MARNFVRASSQYFNYSGTILSAWPVTIAAWFRCVDTTNSQDLVVVLDTLDWRLRLNLNGAGTTVRCIETNAVSGNKIATASGTWTSGVWAHGAATTASGGASRKAYLNGVVGTAETSTQTFTTPNTVEIGRYNNYGSIINYFDGDLAEIGVWNAELSGPEIASLATGLSPISVRPDLLVAYWPMLGQTSTSGELDRVGGFGLTQNASPAKASHPRVFYPARRQFRYGVTAAGGLSIPIAAYHYNHHLGSMAS